MSWIWSALMPHPPVLIHEIGRGREFEAKKTLNGINELTSNLEKPDSLLVLSPHQPYVPGVLFVNRANFYHGSFAMFGVTNVRITASSQSQHITALCEYLAKFSIKTYADSIEDLTQDQGSMVPLYFLKQAWGELPEIIIASPIGLTPKEAFEMGKALADFQSDKRLALLASGDLSHRLTQNAPAGYEPDYAPKFEAAVEEALKNNSPKPIYELDENTLERAGECGLRSVMTMLGLSSGEENEVNEIKVFSHEWPFGVGYCTALCELSRKLGKEQPAPVQLARETVKRLLENAKLPDNGDEVVSSSLWSEHKSCFVSIKTKAGELRGCIGTLSPMCESLDKEIIANAVSASIHDPRFPPMTQDELSSVIFSVDVLSKAEPIENIQELNPKKYGVIVSEGYRRGVLLPDLEGVDTAEQQVQIAAMKAGIYNLDKIKLERFTVTRYKEI
ncbi:MAG: AmmeMemoRadiSam system protein A [Synergistaceae bacterium]|nr:AmmeMemoRadiSam system protein A [Synergistaceae bacterium]